MLDNMETFEVKGDSTTHIRRNVKRQVYKVRDFLLDGGRLTCDIATRRLNIGGSALPRRVKDCRDVLNMAIKARWKPYLTAENVKTKVREYWMEAEDIDAYKLEKASMTMVYPKRPSARGVAAGASRNLSACENV
jgi:hypothetical protein